MAKNFNIRRTAVSYSDNVTDSGNRLSVILAGRHFIDMEAVPALMNQLRDMSLSNIEAAIDKTEVTITAAETLRDVFKNLKKWKEAQKKLAHKDEVARMKEVQKERRKMDLDAMTNIPGRFMLPADPADAMQEDRVD